MKYSVIILLCSIFTFNGNSLLNTSLVAGKKKIAGADTTPADHKFSTACFEEFIHQEFAGKVKGYSFVIVNREGIQAKVAGGWAQDPQDGNVRMETNVPSCIGSVSKVLSGIALLNLMEDRRISVESQLDSKIISNLPPKWERHIGQHAKGITYRQLLQHKSGIRQSDGSNYMREVGIPMQLFTVLKDDIKPNHIGIRDYNNFNIMALMYLIPAMAYPDKCSEIQQEYNHLGIEEFTRKIDSEYRKLYAKYMKEVFLKKSLARISPFCRFSAVYDDFENIVYAKHYDKKTSTSGGAVGGCAAQGSWYISADDLALFTHAYAYTNKYIKPATRELLFDPQAPDERTIYSSLVSNDGFFMELNQRNWAYHGGSQRDYRAALIKLPYDYYGIGMVNSGEISSNTIAQKIIDNFYKATHIGSQGYRMMDFESYQVGNKRMYAGIFKPDTYSPAAYFKDNWDDFLEKWRDLESKGYRMMDFESYQVGNKRMYAGVFKPDTYSPAAYFKDNWDDFLEKWRDLESKGYRMMDFESYQVGNRQMYVGIFKPDTYSPAAYFKDNWADFLEKWRDLESKGYRMMDFESYQVGNKQMYAGIFKPGSYPPAAYFKDNWDDFFEKWRDLESKGYRIMDFESYQVGNKQMYAGIFELATYSPAAYFDDKWNDFLCKWQNLE